MSETPLDPFENPTSVPDPDDPEIWLANFLAEAEALEAQSQQASRDLEQVQAVVDNRFMRLTMGAGGTITSLVFNGSANSATAQLLTEVFAEAHAQAGAEVTRQTLAIMTQIAGEDDPSVELIRDSVPESVAEQMAHDEEHPEEVVARKDSDDDELVLGEPIDDGSGTDEAEHDNVGNF